MRPPWLDRTGRFSPLKASTLVVLCLPAVLIAWDVAAGRYDVRPLVAFERATGHWTLWLLVATLTITPLRQVARWPRLIVARRLMGVATFCYAAVHAATYVAVKAFDVRTILREFTQFVPLPLGLATLLILTLLAATSNDAMVRRLGGRRWQSLHRLVYAAIAIALIHAILETKLRVDQPAIVAGWLAWLMSYRLVLWQWGVERATAVSTLILLTLAAGALTMLGEAAYLHWRTHGSALLVLESNFTFVAGLRAGWYVLAAGLVLTGLALVTSMRPASVPRDAPFGRSSG
jgi:sulfoxide reductase heme-binding subunit YedZ